MTTAADRDDRTPTLNERQSVRVPTDKQAETLRTLAVYGRYIPHGGRDRTLRSLHRHGWVQAKMETGGSLSWVSITPDGLRALARWFEVNPLPVVPEGAGALCEVYGLPVPKESE